MESKLGRFGWCVLRQERFLEKINKMDWLHSPLIHESLLESLIRYKDSF